MSNTVKLIISLAIPLLIGFLGSFFTRPEIGDWYQTIEKPSWNPPSAVFGPVWTFLYVLMGISFFLVWKQRANDDQKTNAILFYFTQLILNLAWSFIFFSEHQIGWAFVEICLLWVVILICIFLFARINKTASWLLVPYISWVTFAGILNYTIWMLND